MSPFSSRGRDARDTFPHALPGRRFALPRPTGFPRAAGPGNGKDSAIYARLDLDPVKASVNTAAAAIMDAANSRKALPAPANGKAPKKVKAKVKESAKKAEE